jgi:hypothetical protein
MPAIKGTIIFTTGTPGAGKTYRRGPWFLVNELLPNTTYRYISNLPLKVEEIGEYLETTTGRPAEEFTSRIQGISQDDLTRWEMGESGPWETFPPGSLNGAHLALDECHRFCSTTSSAKLRKQWATWLAEIRHEGATIEFITQAPSEVAKEIKNRAPLMIELVNDETRRDPIFKISGADWYELAAAFTHKYQPRVWEREKRNEGGKWKLTHEEAFNLEPKLFPLYDTHSPKFQGGKSGSAEKHQFEMRSWIGVLWWFVRRNIFKRRPLMMIAGIMVAAFLLNGGAGWTFSKGYEALMSLLGRSMNMEAQKSPTGSADVKTAPLGSRPPVLEPGSVVRLAGAPPRYEVATSQPWLRGYTTRPAYDVATYQAATRAAEAASQKAEAEAQLVLVSSDSIMLADGTIVAVGESVPSGRLKGKKLLSTTTRAATFEDKTVVMLRRRAK